jgi:fucose permease
MGKLDMRETTNEMEKVNMQETKKETAKIVGISGILALMGAILPVIQGVIADHVGLHHAFVLPLICYLYIVFYALSGSKPNSQRYAKS